MQAGAAFSYFSVDYTSAPQVGPSAFADVNLAGRFGFEGEGRWLNWQAGKYSGVAKSSSYLAGPRFRLARFWRANFYVKGLAGSGGMTYTRPPGSGSYFVWSPGGTAELSITRELALRQDFEYEFWPTAPGEAFAPGHNHGLQPHGFSFGLVYRVRRSAH